MHGTVEDVQVHGNAKDGIDASAIHTATPIVITGNTVYANAGVGIYASGGDGHRQYGVRPGRRQHPGDRICTAARPRSATRSTAAAPGISATGGDLILDNVVYGNSGDGIDRSTAATATPSPATSPTATRSASPAAAIPASIENNLSTTTSRPASRSPAAPRSRSSTTPSISRSARR